MWSWLSTWAQHSLIFICGILHHQMSQPSCSTLPGFPVCHVSPISCSLSLRHIFCLLYFQPPKRWIAYWPRCGFFLYAGISLWCFSLAIQGPHLRGWLWHPWYKPVPLRAGIVFVRNDTWLWKQNSWKPSLFGKPNCLEIGVALLSPSKGNT